MGPPKAVPSTESPSHRRVTAAGENELELSAFRFSEEGDGAAVETSVLPRPARDHFRVFLTVQAEEYLFDHRLLILGEEIAQLGFDDLPVVVDLGAKGMFEREAKLLALFFGKGLVQGLDKSFGIRFFFFVLLVLLAEQGPAARKSKAGGGGCHEFAGERVGGWFFHGV